MTNDNQPSSQPVAEGGDGKDAEDGCCCQNSNYYWCYSITATSQDIQRFAEALLVRINEADIASKELTAAKAEVARLKELTVKRLSGVATLKERGELGDMLYGK